MIFGSFGLLIIALALLIAAVVKSSVAIGVASLVCTALAVVCLVAANAYYRKTRPGPSRLAGEGGIGPAAAAPAGPVPTVMMVPQMAMATGASFNGHSVAGAEAPVENYDQLNAAQAAAAVAMLNLDQLHTLRRYEVEHAARKTVLSAIDDRVTSIVSLRKALSH